MESNESNLTLVAVRGTFWTLAANYGGKVLVFLSTVVLAQLLTKEDFGVAGYALVVISFLEAFSDLGMGQALIFQREEPGTADTAFWLGLVIATALFVVTWITAPLTGMLFNDERAVDVTRALALTFPITALSDTHSALLNKKLLFGRKVIPEFVRASGKGLVSIVLALLGFGTWSLIFGQVGGTAVAVFAFWHALRWRPSFRFTRRLVRPLLSYGVKIAVFQMLGMVFLNLDYLLVGRYLGPVALGAYTLAFRVPELLVKQFLGMVSKVTFPVFSKMRNDQVPLGDGFLTTVRYMTMITIPMALGLALVAEPFVLTVFGQKWAEAIPVIAAISIYTLLRSLSFNIGDVYKAQGRPGLLTALAVVRVAILLPALWWAVTGPATITAVGWTQAVVAVVVVVINLVIAQRMLGLRLGVIATAVRPAAIGGSVMTLAVLGTLTIVADAPPVVQLVAAVSAGASTYIGALWWLQRDVVMKAGRTLRAAFSRR